jgi:hypothetical protein
MELQSVRLLVLNAERSSVVREPQSANILVIDSTFDTSIGSMTSDREEHP